MVPRTWPPFRFEHFHVLHPVHVARRREALSFLELRPRISSRYLLAQLLGKAEHNEPTFFYLTLFNILILNELLIFTFFLSRLDSLALVLLLELTSKWDKRVRLFQ